MPTQEDFQCQVGHLPTMILDKRWQKETPNLTSARPSQTRFERGVGRRPMPWAKVTASMCCVVGEEQDLGGGEDDGGRKEEGPSEEGFILWNMWASGGLWEGARRLRFPNFELGRQEQWEGRWPDIESVTSREIANCSWIGFMFTPNPRSWVWRRQEWSLMV